MKKIIIIFSLITFFSACSEKKENLNNPISSDEMYLGEFCNEKLKEDLKYSIFTGDTVAYDELKEIYYLSGNKKELLFYSMFMANNYDYLDAYEDCFYLLKSNDSIKNNFDDKLANYYLLKGYEINKKKFEQKVIKKYKDKESIPSSNNILGNGTD